MHVLPTSLRDVKRLQPKRFSDERGWFAEVFSAPGFAAAGLPVNFVQDNHSHSGKGVLRGLHYQLGRPQGKLIRVLAGEIWDVAVDLRRSSPQFGQWTGLTMRPCTPEGDLEMLWVPEGFAHGFLVLSPSAEVLYKTTDLYHPEGERSILWNDSDLSIDWPLADLGGIAPNISAKDAKGVRFRDADLP